MREEHRHLPPTVTNVAPAVLERVERPVVVHEKIVPTQRTEVQPIIHREREQVEVHEVLQPMRETDIAPTMVQNVQLQPSYFEERASDVSFQQQYREASTRIRSDTVISPTVTQQVERAPIVEEVIHRKVIEEVQPVLYRETIKPTVVEATKPIYERVYEMPELREEIRPMVDLGTKYLQTPMGTAGTAGLATAIPAQAQCEGPHVIRETTTTVVREPLGHSQQIPLQSQQIPLQSQQIPSAAPQMARQV